MERGEFHTFSIVGRCARTGDFGVAVTTARPAVDQYGDEGLRRYRQLKL